MDRITANTKMDLKCEYMGSRDLKSNRREKLFYKRTVRLRYYGPLYYFNYYADLC